jgi:uncharacterized protein YlbG (UPF0298 family)
MEHDVTLRRFRVLYVNFINLEKQLSQNGYFRFLASLNVSHTAEQMFVSAVLFR